MKRKMKRKFAFFGFGRRIVFSVALFVLVFAAASIVKIQAAGNATGWLWGGSEDANISGSMGVVDGNDTMAYWVSMNKSNCDSDGNGVTDTGNYPDCPTGQFIADYGVSIPNGDGVLSGYAWSPGLGYLSFKESDLSGCPNAPCRAWRAGDKIFGWARFMEIKMGAYAGGWEGWVKLRYTISGVGQMGVEVSGENLTGFGWNGETPGVGGNAANGLGWIDFSRARVPLVGELTASGTTLSSDWPCRQISGTLTNNIGTKQITFDATAAAKVTLSTNNCSSTAETAVCNVTGNGSCSVWATASDFSQGATENIAVSSPGFTSTIAPVVIDQFVACSINCPDSVLIAPGSADSFSCSVSGTNCSATGCGIDADANSILEDVNFNSSSKQCEVTVETGADFKHSATVETTTSGDSDTTTIRLKRLGWIEVNP